MNQSKQRCAGGQGAAGMVNQRVEQPNLSGSYIRSLVKQLTSSGAHANTGVAPYGNALDSHGGLRGATPNVIASYLGEELRRGTFQAVTDKSCEKESPFVNPDSSHVTAAEDAINNVTIGAVQQKPPQVKKQARRRPQTRRPSQECILNIAEARREIVTALHLHRAGNPGTTASRICTAETASIPPMGKSGRSSSIVKSSEKSSRNYSNNNNNGRAGSISRCNACCNIRGNEAKAITICSHLLCWICLGEWLRSASPIKECPVCAKPLAGKDVIPIAPGVTTQVQPHAQEIAQTSSSPSAPVALQSAPLLVNPLPVPQPAWSITEPSLATLMRPAGAIVSPIFQGMSNITQPDINFVQVEPYAVYPSTLFPPTTCYGTEIPMTSTSPLKNIQEADPWHVPADEGEYAEIRSLGDRHGMEWSETVNLAARFKFVEGSTTSEHLDANPEARGQEYHKEYDKNNNRNHLQQLPEQPLAEKYEDRHDVPQLFEETLAADPRPQEHAVRADNLLDVLPELPAEGLWPDEAFDYQDWIQDLNKRDYNDILVLDGNQSLAERSTNSEILSQANKFGPCEDSSDADTAVQSDLSSEIQDNLRVSSAQVGDKRKIDSYDRLL